MSDEIHLEGGCHCSHIRYRISAMPYNVEYCHCRMCQTSVGAVVVNWMDLRMEQVSWMAAMPEYYASSHDVLRGFCPKCGCSVSFHSRRHPGLITLTVATLDDPNTMKPTQHIYTESQCQWLRIEDDCKRFARDAH